MIRCKDCKFWDPKAKEVEEFFAISSARRANHPAGIGICERFYDSPNPPFPADEAFGWRVYQLDNDLIADILTGPEYGCVRGEPKP